MNTIFITKAIGLIVYCLLIACAFLRWNKQGRDAAEASAWICAIIMLSYSFYTIFAWDGVYVSHDMIGIMSRIQGMTENIRTGQFPSIILPNQANGYGCMGILYPHLVFYIPALLNLLGVPVVLSYNMLIMFIQLLSFMVMFLSVKSIAQSDLAAIIAAGVYSAFPYRVSELYFRGSLSEATAMIFIPLLIVSFYRIVNRIGKNNSVILCISMTGLIQSHVLTLVMSIGLIIIYLLINIKKVFKKECLIEIGIAAVLTIIINLWYIIPFLKFYRFETNIDELSLNMSNHAETFYNLLRGIDFHASEPGIIGIIGLTVIIIDLLFVIIISISFSKQSAASALYPKSFRILIYYCFAVSIIGIIMTTKYFPWDLLQQIIPQIGIFQFPFRCLVMTTPFSCLVFGLSMEYLLNKSSLRLSIPVILCLLSLISNKNIYKCLNFNDVFDYSVNDFSFDYRIEYLPKGMNSSHFASQKPIISDGVETEYYYKDSAILIWKYNNTSAQPNINAPVTFEAPLTYYPGYYAICEDISGNLITLNTYQSDNFRVKVDIPGDIPAATLTIRYSSHSRH